MFASSDGKVECVRILLERGAQADTQNQVRRVICEWNIVSCDYSSKAVRSCVWLQRCRYPQCSCGKD